MMHVAFHCMSCVQWCGVRSYISSEEQQMKIGSIYPEKNENSKEASHKYAFVQNQQQKRVTKWLKNLYIEATDTVNANGSVVEEEEGRSV